MASPSRVASEYLHSQSAARVASRFLVSKTWGSTERLIADYRSALGIFRAHVEEQRTRTDGSPNNLLLAYKLTPAVKAGRELVEWIVQTRAIPTAKAKSMEMAARTLGAIRKSPPDIIAWTDKNGARLDFLLEAATWPERSAEGEIITVGPLKVHNTTGATEKQFSDIQKLVESTVRIMTSTLDYKKVLYGDVYVVGQLKQATTVAWYNVNDDDVYLRSMAKKGEDDVQNLIHEFGHRYWHKVMTPTAKKAIGTIYTTLKYVGGAEKVVYPKVGDPLPIPVKGQKERPIITGYNGLYYTLSTGGAAKVSQVHKILQEISMESRFPSRYAATSIDEFFSECFSFYALDQKLTPRLREQFEEALRA